MNALQKDVDFAFEQHCGAMLTLRVAEAEARKTRETLQSLKRLKETCEAANSAVQSIDILVAPTPESSTEPAVAQADAVTQAQIDAGIDAGIDSFEARGTL